MTHTSTAILRPVYQYYKKTYSSRPVTASRVSCVSIYPCAIYSSSEPVRLLCKSQNSPTESYVCTLLLLVGLGIVLHLSHKAFDLQQSRSESRGCRLGGNTLSQKNTKESYQSIKPKVTLGLTYNGNKATQYSSGPKAITPPPHLV